VTNLLKRAVTAALGRGGYEVSRRLDPASLRDTHPDLDARFLELYPLCAPATMTTPERMYALYQAVSHVDAAGIDGDVVECGVWRGGSSMLAASTLLALGDEARSLWLYDTFEGMPEPGPADVHYTGEQMAAVWDRYRDDRESGVLAYSALDEVQANMASTGFPAERTHYVKGRVEDTIPARIPERIAVLRLDTDWYESTLHELVHLYPRLQPGGVLIIDDYGHWQGARQAVDEYFDGRGIPMLLNRIDYTGRIAVKPAA
jgi:O-methyltransferase